MAVSLSGKVDIINIIIIDNFTKIANIVNSVNDAILNCLPEQI